MNPPPPMSRFLHILLRGIFLIVEAVSHLVYPLIYNNPEKVPPIPEDEIEILTCPAVDLATKIQNGSLKSRTVVQTFINRAKSVHSYINAFVDTRYEDALREADAVDELIQKTPAMERAKLFESKPFLGVPFTSKDSISVGGMKQVVGLVCRKDKVASEDAPCVANLKNAGAICLGVTNVPELCMWMESYNKVYGRTNNPYHLGRIVGGSSGGEGAAIASASSPFGIGSDIGGSIRMPAFFCGIYGHKCSTGEPVSNSGQLPLAVGSLNNILSTGPMTRHAKDLLPAFKALISNQEIIENRLRLSEPVNVKKLKIYYMEGILGFPILSNVHHELITCQMDLLKDLRVKTGLQAEKLEMQEEFYWSFEMWNSRMNSEPNAPPHTLCLTDMVEPRMNPWLELLKWFMFKSTNYTLYSILTALFYEFGNSKELPKWIALVEDFKKKLNNILGDDGVLIFPSHPLPAPYHGQTIIKPFNIIYTGIFNALEVPVTQVPLGISPTLKAPLGVQLVAGVNQDRLTIALAEEIEKIRGGQTWCTKY